MGNTSSEFFEPVDVDLWWNNTRENNANNNSVMVDNNVQTPNVIETTNNDEISAFREKRIKIIGEKKKQMENLREELARQKNENQHLRNFIKEKGLEFPVIEENIKVDESQQTDVFEDPGGFKELQFDLETAKKELQGFENERKEYETHIIALKDIITVSKQLLLMREKQIKELGEKIKEIEKNLAQQELRVFSSDLRREYERQLKNMKQLRELYEERQRNDKTLKDGLQTQLDEAKSALTLQETKNRDLETRVEELEKENSDKYDTIINLDSQLGLTKAECAEIRTEMSVINQLFSQILVGFNNGQEVDLDKLTETLEENHDLLTEIVVNEESNQSSALPKVLLDLVNQVNSKSITNEEELETLGSSQPQSSLSSASEIVQNLPKVWKVLTELLSHQTTPLSVLQEDPEQPDKNPCYKSVQTPAGPALVLSVSKTYIRLKNLIVEKKSLEKETMRLKQLNTHLETRLQDQEKRLEMVSDELSKTWNVVGKMQKQHQQLHTQEKILRYELAQKRKLLNELKEELEYCREKWLQAREKNITTEEQWKQLRNEFALRKKTIVSKDLNNSVESGYSDERESSSSDEETDVAKKEENEENNKTILAVIKNEIEKIEEECLTLTEQTSTTTTNETENSLIDNNCLDALERIDNDANASLESDMLEEEIRPTASSSSISNDVLLNTNGGTNGVVHSKKTLKTDDLVQNKVDKDKTQEEMLFAREERLQRLEKQAKSLLTQTTNTSNRSNLISNKLEDLHEQYGGDSKNKRKDIDEMYKKLEEDILETIKKTKNGEEFSSKPIEISGLENVCVEEKTTQIETLCDKAVEPEPSTSSGRTAEDRLARREKRLQLMEEQAQQLVNKALKNSLRGSQFCTKLNKLHDRYRESSDSSEDIQEAKEEECQESNIDINETED